MRILITAAVWGLDYARLLANYSIASQLAPGNIPKLSESNFVTYQIVTTAADKAWLVAQPSIQELSRVCTIEWELFEDHDIDPNKIPVGLDTRKYDFLSRLQNLAFSRSAGYDAIVFNYADFIWADGSLTNSVALLSDETDAVLTLTMPVDQMRGLRALDRHPPTERGTRDLAPRELARIAVSNLHDEAKLRFWHSSRFTSFPSYLIWAVGSEGLLVRAYHQTVLVLRVTPDSSDFRKGITKGTLDGDYSAQLAKRGRTRHADDSDATLVISLYADTKLNSETDQTREQSVCTFLQTVATDEQRRFAEIPMMIKSDMKRPALWDSVRQESADLVARLHRAASDHPFAAMRARMTNVLRRSFFGRSFRFAKRAAKTVLFLRRDPGMGRTAL
jgi:hypothetical protein